MARFDDRFHLSGVRSSAPTPSPWDSSDSALEALAPIGTTVSWSDSILDPSGLASVFVVWRAQRIELYGAAQGEPLVPWRASDGAQLPRPTSAVRIGATWFFTENGAGGASPGRSFRPEGGATLVWRVDGGIARRVARLARLGTTEPRLVRRVHGEGLALLTDGPSLESPLVDDWFVVPIDSDTGDLDAPVRLIAADLGSRSPPSCGADDDGWLIESSPVASGSYAGLINPSPLLRAPALPMLSFSSVAMRLRVEPGRVCVDRIAASVDALPTVAHARREGDDALRNGVPLAVTDASNGRRQEFRCTP
jgi:hypothetical protein